MNNVLIFESDSCKGCASVKDKHTRLADKASQSAKLMKDEKMKSSYSKKADYERKLAAADKCSDCKKKIDENFYAPRNAVTGGKPSLGDSTDDTLYARQDRRERVYQPSKQDAHQKGEYDQKVAVPKSVTGVLTSRAKDARAYSEKLNVTQTEDKQFYLDLAQAFDDLNEYLKSGTVYDIKMASIFLTSLMGPMLYEIPTEVVRFIAYGGTHAPLKSFMNSITTPNGGFNVNGEQDKL